ncbi:hypothetical protein TRM7557_00162 [Tritonibacter multivorans]|uniref:Uncharacterized protein n=1 Tax=Tritonibacter multivorans TaxID=928856 RepID=A0A0P1GEM6_9RHOB|nr:hypothetical protein [Tritonibacter multivorans]MDA7422432.1 hypothetical protein [Tritonibacter multivorans]CUH74952.1 hypothetical protein TRM7557_00162 [Tritonibacter multivorans]SFD44151.1 hypothetical protein SAMN04488049_11372 [Tritonibacter multivorans]
MKYHVLFAIVCAVVAMGVDYERQGHYRGLAFGELEVSSYMEGYAPRIAGLGTEIAQGDLQLTDVVQLRGALVEMGAGQGEVDLGGSALTPPATLNRGRLTDSH